ncbi:twin-arginine translocase TatA/TatE family subunit [Chloroflexota bacterium]
MDFFGLGLGEVLLVLVIALIIWGPERIPEVARTLGKTVRTFRKATFDLTNMVTKEFSIEEKDSQSKSGANRKENKPDDKPRG